MKTIVAALAAFVLLPAAAQSTGYTPTAKEAQDARDNAKRDARLADAMEKARLKEEGKPAAATVLPGKPQPQKVELGQPKKQQDFTAVVPGAKKPVKTAKKKASTA